LALRIRCPNRRKTTLDGQRVASNPFQRMN